MALDRAHRPPRSWLGRSSGTARRSDSAIRRRAPSAGRTTGSASCPIHVRETTSPCTGTFSATCFRRRPLAPSAGPRAVLSTRSIGPPRLGRSSSSSKLRESRRPARCLHGCRRPAVNGHFEGGYTAHLGCVQRHPSRPPRESSGGVRANGRRDRRGGRLARRDRPRPARARQEGARRHGARGRRGAHRAHHGGGERAGRHRGRAHLRPHPAAPSRRQARDRLQGAAQDAGRSLDGLHPGRRARLPRDRRRSRAGLEPDEARRTRSRSSPTARPCSASATSARRPPCR